MNRRRLLVLALLVAAAPAATADRLHLAGGGRIDTPRWWIEGRTLVYETADGTIGIPRSIVQRIETTQAAAGAAASSPAARPAAPATARGAGPDRDPAERLRAGKAALDRREFAAASAIFRQLLEDPAPPVVAHVGYALAELGLGHEATALSAVLDGLVRDPERPELHEILGELRYREERVEEALRSWRHAFELAPSDRLREKILKAERELHSSGHYDLASSPHFDLRYDGDVDSALAAQVLDHLERRYFELTELYRHDPAQPVIVHLLAREAFRAVTQSPEWVGGLYDGKIRVPLGGLTRLTRPAERLLSHELTHAIVHSKSHGQAPRWLQEGLAQIAEGRTLAPAAVEELRRTLAAQPPARRSAPAFSYPFALAFTEFLIELGEFGSLVDLLDVLAEGRPVDAALVEVYGRSHADLVRAWGERLLAEGPPG